MVECRSFDRLEPRLCRSKFGQMFLETCEIAVVYLRISVMAIAYNVARCLNVLHV